MSQWGDQQKLRASGAMCPDCGMPFPHWECVRMVEAGADRRYRTIVADPPWPFRWSGGGATRVNARGEVHVNHKFKKGLEYETMSVDEIAALPVVDRADDDAALFLWTTEEMALEGHAVRVARAWGFEPMRTIVWCKRGAGLGKFPRPAHELVLVCRRGSIDFASTDTMSWQVWKFPYENGARKHSAKPDGFYDLVERVTPGPYLELFARRARFGWDYWGDQSLGTVELVPETEGEAV
jgi:N6-adenosine-specific RNA methylase IME4